MRCRVVMRKSRPEWSILNRDFLDFTDIEMEFLSPPPPPILDSVSRLSSND